jgi:sterol desaturase/sphingolipid hydroxylase (fatty acid hydroxylase superfamily)
VQQALAVVSWMMDVVYFGEMVIAPLLAITLIASSTFTTGATAMLFVGGVAIWTLGEYFGHRFVLHNLAPIQHRAHHTHPDKLIVEIFWQIWICFAVVFWIAGSAVLAGVLTAYAWYLFVHHCAHHRPSTLPKSLLKHHHYHHRCATKNYGVSTTLWDHFFGTMLR